MDQSAEDDKERERNRARLYAPPKGAPRARVRAQRPSVMSRAEARALTAQAAAEDARFGRGGG